MRKSDAAQDAVRGDHGEVAQLLEREGGRIYKSSEKRLVELAKSHVAGCAAKLYYSLCMQNGEPQNSVQIQSMCELTQWSLCSAA